MSGSILEGTKRKVQEHRVAPHDSLRLEEFALLELLRRQVNLAVA
jgi:hypothetical protein